MLVKADLPVKVCHLFKGNRIIVADNFAVQKPSQTEVNCSRAAGVSPALVLTGEWCEHSRPWGTASHSLAAMLPSYLNRRMHEAFLQNHYLVFVLNHVLEGTCFDIRGFRRQHHQLTVGAPYNNALYCFRSQPWFHSRFTRSSRGQGTCHHVM